MAKMFSTNLTYQDRESKADYIFDKYKEILSKSVLDIGADAMYLKTRIETLGGEYKGIGYGKDIDLDYNLEQTPYPFNNDSFGTVVCFDVLEHLEEVHKVFAELCRISQEYILISLPNPWADFFNVLLNGDYSEEIKLKFYGLPKGKPVDRHRWFFSEKEAIEFINHNATANGFEVIQFDTLNQGKKFGGNSLKGILGRFLLRRVFRNDIHQLGLHHSTLWFVLKKSKK